MLTINQKYKIKVTPKKELNNNNEETQYIIQILLMEKV